MSIDVGGIVVLRSRAFLHLSLVFILLVACSKNNRQVEDIPIVVSQPGQQKIDINLVIANTQEEVQKVLPNAYLVFFSYIGECKELPKLQGEIRLDFAQNDDSWFGDRTFLARATINTMEQNLSFGVKDETKHYPNPEALSLDGMSTQEIADLLHAHLVSTDRCTGTIALTRATTDSPWRARCGSPEEILLECIEIEPDTGEITDLN
jgi:hypothetical protein